MTDFNVPEIGLFKPFPKILSIIAEFDKGHL